MSTSNADRTLSSHPTVGEFMTPVPATVDAGLRVMDAFDRMYMDNVRHLPVVNEQGSLVGMLSSRDVAQAAAAASESELEGVSVADKMAKAPYHCQADTPLNEVALAMETMRLGSAVVTDNGKPVGIFTTTDALIAVRSLIAGRHVEASSPAQHLPPTGPGEDATTTRGVHVRKGVPRRDRITWGLFPGA